MHKFTPYQRIHTSHNLPEGLRLVSFTQGETGKALRWAVLDAENRVLARVYPYTGQWRCVGYAAGSVIRFEGTFPNEQRAVEWMAKAAPEAYRP